MKKSFETIIKKINLKELYESETVEFKSEYNKDTKEKIEKTLLGFANTYGGYLIVGIKDNLEICGISQEELEKINRDLSNFLDNNKIEVSSSSATVENKIIFIIDVEEGKDKPYYFYKSHKVYKRVLSSTREADEHDIRNLYRELRTIKKTIISVFRKYTTDLGFLEWALIEKKYNSESLEKLKKIDKLFIEWRKKTKNDSFKEGDISFYFFLKEIIFEENSFYIKLDILKWLFLQLSKINEISKIEWFVEDHFNEFIFDSSLTLEFDYDFSFIQFHSSFNVGDSKKNDPTIKILINKINNSLKQNLITKDQKNKLDELWKEIEVECDALENFKSNKRIKKEIEKLLKSRKLTKGIT